VDLESSIARINTMDCASLFVVIRMDCACLFVVIVFVEEICEKMI
jgi:hypothetical protein